jgi:hypothetical protein
MTNNETFGCDSDRPFALKLEAGMSISIGNQSRIDLHPLFSCGPVLDVVDELLYGFERDGVVDRSTNT